jgi:hypothetical protein
MTHVADMLNNNFPFIARVSGSGRINLAELSLPPSAECFTIVNLSSREKIENLKLQTNSVVNFI